MNCRKCRHVGTVPNSIHKSCHHPQALQILSDHTHLKLHMERLSTSETFPRNPLDITLEPAYERMVMLEGYCLWPINYDPKWIKACNGYEENKGAQKSSGCVCHGF